MSSKDLTIALSLDESLPGSSFASKGVVPVLTRLADWILKFLTSSESPANKEMFSFVISVVSSSFALLLSVSLEPGLFCDMPVWGLTCSAYTATVPIIQEHRIDKARTNAKIFLHFFVFI